MRQSGGRLLTIKYTRVLPTGAGTPDRVGFVNAFKEVFKRPPYGETYTDRQVIEKVWMPHLEHGIVVLARDEGKVVGFGCALPLTKAPDDIQDFLASSLEAGLLPEDFDPKRTWHMSDMGILKSYRGRGISYGLIRDRLITASHNNASHYVMRTASVGSPSRHLYEQVGAVPLASEQDVSQTDQVTQNHSQAVSRIYLYGRCNDALSEIFKRDNLSRATEGSVHPSIYEH